VAEAARDNGVSGSTVSGCGQRRWWSTPGALVNGGEVRAKAIWVGKTRGGGAHHEAEVAAMAALNRRSGTVSHAREGPHELTTRAGRVRVLELGRMTRKGGNGTAADAFETWLGGAGQRERGGRRGRVRLAWWLAARGSRQRAPTVGRGRHRCRRTGKGGGARATRHGATDKRDWASRGPGVSGGVREGERRASQRGGGGALV
jgi:hypothetical protein